MCQDPIRRRQREDFPAKGYPDLVGVAFSPHELKAGDRRLERWGSDMGKNQSECEKCGLAKDLTCIRFVGEILRFAQDDEK